MDLVPLDFTFTWPASDCHKNGTGTAINCLDAAKTHKGKFKGVRGTPAVVTYKIKFLRAADQAPFKPPVVLTITRGLIDWQGEIHECVQSPTGSYCRLL